MLNNIYGILFIYTLSSITLSFVLLPFLPLKFILDYKLFLAPIVVTIYWLIFDGCHLSKMHNNEKGYIHDLIYNLFNISLTKKQERHFGSFSVCIIPTIIILRILIYKNYFCKIYK